MWSTTVYEPVGDGHRHIPVDPAIPNSPCSACDGAPWDGQHMLVERHVSDALDGPGLFCVEASDDNGRSYASNGLRWVDVEDAKRWAGGLALRWFGCSSIRVRACDDEGQPTGDTIHQTL